MSTPYSPRFYRQFLIHHDRLCLIAHNVSSPNTPIGLVSAVISNRDCDLSQKQNPPFVQILTLGVLSEYRRSGIASSLVRSAVRTLLDGFRGSPASPGAVVSAHVQLSNEGGRNFYSSVGLNGQEQFILRDAYRANSVPVTARDALVITGELC
jgi:ribosomal protein S18 acetylase RimI-like enzyme